MEEGSLGAITHWKFMLSKSSSTQDNYQDNGQATAKRYLSFGRHDVLDKTKLSLGRKHHQIDTLEAADVLLNDLFQDKQNIEVEQSNLLNEKISCHNELQRVDRQIEELLQKKKDLQDMLLRIGSREMELQQIKEQLDNKLSGVMEESARFETNLRHIKGEPEKQTNGSPKNGSVVPLIPTSSIAQALSTVVVSEQSHPQMFVGHKEAVMCVDFQAHHHGNATIVSGSGDRTLLEWDLKTGSKKKTLSGHTGWVSCLQLKDDSVVSGSSDNSLKLWSLSNYKKPKLTMNGHGAGVLCLQFDESKVISGSMDKTVKKWDIVKGTCTLTMQGHSSFVSGLQFFDYGLATCSGDRTIRMWDLRNGECHRTLKGHLGGVSCIQFDETKVITGSDDATFKVWDLRTGACISTISVGSAINAIRFDSKRIVVAASDKLIKFYDPYIFTEQQALSGHTGNVTSLKFNNDMMVSSSTDCTVRIWSFKKNL